MQRPSSTEKEPAKHARLLNFRATQKNTLKAIFDIALPSGRIIRVALLHESLPGKPYAKPDGSQNWTSVLDFDTCAARERFQALVLPLALQALERAEDAA